MKKKTRARFMIVITVVVLLVVGLELFREFKWSMFGAFVCLLVACGLFVTAYKRAETET